MNWPLVKLGDFCITGSGGTPSRSIAEYYQGDIPWIKSGDLRENIVINATEFISEEAIKNSSAKMVAKGSILLAMYGATVGRMALLGIDAATNQAVCNITPDGDRAFTKYVYYALLSKVPEFLKNAVGGAQPNISQGIIRDTLIPLPPLEEQKRIAAILDKADAIRRKRQQAIKLADDFLRSVFLEMFGDPVTNPKGWEVKAISEYIADGTILQVQDGNHGNDHPKVSDFIEQGIPFVTANVVREGKILFDQCYYLSHEWLRKLRIGFAKPRDVLISHKGSLGFTAVLDDSFENYIFSPQTTYYRVNERRLVPEYLKAYFDSSYFQAIFEKEGIQSTRAYIGITRQKDLPLMLPDIQSQLEYVEKYSKYYELRKKIYRSKNGLPICFEALSQKAFSGQL